MKRRIGRFSIHLLVFSIPFLIGLGGAIWVVSAWMESPEVRPLTGIQVQGTPGINPSLPTALILVDPMGTEPTGLLAPYGILAGSGVVNVLTVAPDRVLSPVQHGVDLLPHVGFQELDAVLGRKPDFVIVPHIEYPTSPRVTEWIRSQDSDSTLVVVSSAGATASFDAAFRVLSNAVAVSPRHPLEGRLPAGEPFDFRLKDAAALYLTAGFVWDKRDVAVTIFDGIDEVALGAILDLYPRVFDADVFSVGVTRRVYTTSNGLHLVPWLGLDEEPKIHELIVPGTPDESDFAAILDWAAEEEVPVFNPFGGHASGKFAYDAALEGIAAARSASVARAVANMVQYPLDEGSIDSAPSWPYDVMVVPFAFGLLALFIFRIARKRRIPIK